MYQSINDNIKKLCPHISREELGIFNTYLTHKSFEKRETIYKVDEDIDSIYFVFKGLVKSYVTSSKLEQIILYFIREGWWLADIEAFHLEGTSNMIYQSIERTDVLCLSREDSQKLIDEFPIFQDFFYRLLLRNTVNLQKRYTQQLSLDVSSRYRNFEKDHADIIDRVKQKDIASFLGATPEFLSKIKSSKK